MITPGFEGDTACTASNYSNISKLEPTVTVGLNSNASMLNEKGGAWVLFLTDTFASRNLIASLSGPTGADAISPPDTSLSD